MSWRGPSVCDALQFSGLNLSALQSLAKHYRISCMPLMGEQLNLPVLLRTLLRGNFTRGAYYREFVRLSEAKVLLVWHDTNLNAYSLKKYLPIPIWSIQNGIRHDVAPARGTGLLSGLRTLGIKSVPSIDRYFVFGNATTQLLKPLVQTEFITSGSFRLNEYVAQRQSSNASSASARSRVGLIVSFPNAMDIPGRHIHGNFSPFVNIGGQSVSYHHYFRADGILAEALVNVTRELGYSFSIIGKRSNRDRTERDFFAEVPGCQNIEVCSHEKGFGYELADSFDALFTVDSTLGYEMLAVNKHVGFVSNRFKLIGLSTSEMRFGTALQLPDEGPIWTSETHRPEIENFAKRFFGLANAEWTQIQRDLTPQIMQVDPDNSILRSSLDLILQQKA